VKEETVAIGNELPNLRDEEQICANAMEMIRLCCDIFHFKYFLHWIMAQLFNGLISNPFLLGHIFYGIRGDMKMSNFYFSHS
jgi:hypothetical protein